MASEPLPPTDFADGTTLFDESLMSIDNDGTRWTGAVVGHVDLAGAQAALDAAKTGIRATAVRHAWAQVNRHAAYCAVSQDELLDTFAMFLDPDPKSDRPSDMQLSDLQMFRASARDSVCGCTRQDGDDESWWLRPATSRDLHAFPITLLTEAC